MVTDRRGLGIDVDWESVDVFWEFEGGGETEGGGTRLFDSDGTVEFNDVGGGFELIEAEMVGWSVEFEDSVIEVETLEAEDFLEPLTLVGSLTVK